MSGSLLLTINLLAILSLGVIFNVAHSLRYDLQSGTSKCISEEIKSNAMSVGKYTVISPNEGFPLPDSHRVTVRVNSPHGNNYHFGDHVEAGNFAFTAAESGGYTACFWTPDHKVPVTVTIEFDWRTGVAAKDWSNVAKKGQVEFNDNFVSSHISWLKHSILFFSMEKILANKASAKFSIGCVDKLWLQ
ncbi:hypothetical protein ACB092_01G333500 [Castanea dentata]